MIQLGGNLSKSFPFIDDSFRFFNPPVQGTFFWTTSRIWEFLFGTLVFIYSKKYQTKRTAMIEEYKLKKNYKLRKKIKLNDKIQKN